MADAPRCSPFSPDSLDEISREDQFYRTENCISSRLMFGVFLAYFLILALMVLFFLTLAILRVVRTKEAKLSPYMKTVLCSLGYSFFKALLLLLFLLGWDTRWRYLFQPLPMPFLMMNATGILVEWFKAIRSVELFNNSKQPLGIFNRFSMSILGLNISFSGSIAVCAGILPAIFFDSDPVALNWSFACSQALSGLAGFGFSVYMLHTANILIKSIAPAKEMTNSSRVVAIEKKLKKFTFIFRNLCMNASFTAIAIPLWMGISTHYGVGMHYFYFVYFFVLLPSEISIVFMLYWMVQRIREGGTKNSQVGSTEGSKKRAASISMASSKPHAASTTENTTIEEREITFQNTSFLEPV